MKLIITFLIILLSVACNTTKFKVGECIQKPDSVTAFKVTEVKESGYVLLNTFDQNTLVIDSSDSSWMKSSCPN